MKTFESCNRVWLTMPEDGKCPVKSCERVRVLGTGEQSGIYRYWDTTFHAEYIDWTVYVGWYPVKPDGTDDHEIAAKFITEPTPLSALPSHTIKWVSKIKPPVRITRRRFKLSTH